MYVFNAYVNIQPSQSLIKNKKYVRAVVLNVFTYKSNKKLTNFKKKPK